VKHFRENPPKKDPKYRPIRNGCQYKCEFCFKNGEPESIYKSHPLKTALNYIFLVIYLNNLYINYF
jgi:hypothetical protein